MSRTGILATIVILLLLEHAVPAFANLIQNPGFEIWTDSRTPASWTVEDTIYAKVFKESTRVFHGAYSAKLQRFQIGTGNNKGLLQRVAVPGRGQYAASMRVYHNPDSVRCALIITWRNSSQTPISSWPTVYAESVHATWQVVQKIDTPPTGAAYADFIIRTYGRSTPNPSPSGGTFVIDSIIFYNTTAIEETENTNRKPQLRLDIEPSVFRTITRINLAINPLDFIAVKIYDATGRLVKTIRAINQHQELYTISWDGRDEHGLLSAPGVYFIALETKNAQTNTAKTLFLR